MLASAAAAPDAAAALAHLAAATLAPAARFHDAMGGLAGYQLTCVRMLARRAAGVGASTSPAAAPGATLSPPGGLDLTDEPAATAAKAQGLARVGTTAELVPLGGASDRLGLVCETTGAPLPAALLPYGGRPMLEGMLRDTQAREYLAWRVHGVQHVTPVVLMTSCAKGGHAAVAALLADAQWYGRGADSFRLLCQPLVPVVAAADGRWLLAAPAAPELRPGGHGALWKCLADNGGFAWLAERGATAALVRQISNPLAGTDGTSLALAGAGAAAGASFGFAACPRRPGATEGVVARVTAPRARAGAALQPPASHVTCVEYTEFEGAGLTEAALGPLPANSNLLFVDLAAAEAAATAPAPAPPHDADAASTLGCLPGLVLNTCKSVRPGGGGAPVDACRLESTMQCLVDAFPRRAASTSFAVSGPRRLVTSSAKRARAPGGSLAQTPDGSFLDLCRNGADALRAAGWAGVPADAAFEAEEAADGRLPLVFVHHPALGPLWSVVRAKVGAGAVAAPGSELVLDLAECRLAAVTLAGSLRILADAPLGHTVGGEGGEGGGRLAFSDAGGRARLERVAVRNAGVAWGHPANVPWRHRLARDEEVVVRLRGRSEFDARDVALSGSAFFDVPDGHRLTLRPGPAGETVSELTALPREGGPGWSWCYALGAGGRVELTLRDGGEGGD